MQVINMLRLAIWNDSWIQVCISLLDGKILSISSSMDVLKSKAMLKALKWILIKYDKIEVIQAQEIN
jgi:hypothetical protein